MDAGDRARWQGKQDERPLTPVGRRQAAALADALAHEPIDTLYSSPALRCRQTIEPLEERLGLPITVIGQLGEKAWRAPDGWDADRNGGANVSGFAAGRTFAVIEQLHQDRTAGHLIVCSHGHIIPALVSMLIGAHDLRGVPELERRGQWYRMSLVGKDPSVIRCAAKFQS